MVILSHLGENKEGNCNKVEIEILQWKLSDIKKGISVTSIGASPSLQMIITHLPDVLPYNRGSVKKV